jgi:tripartite-type tricarboxylate transporter receptor subunit TctC
LSDPWISFTCRVSDSKRKGDAMHQEARISGGSTSEETLNKGATPPRHSSISERNADASALALEMRLDQRFPSNPGLTAAACVLAFGSVFVSLHAQAQSYPAKPLRLVVGFAPGGLVDILARTSQPKVQAGLGQSLVIENQAGGGGTVAEGTVAKSAPDGYTMLMTADSPPANMHLFKNLNYDLLRDLRPVAMVARVPLVLLTHPSVPANTYQEFVAYARAKAGAVSYASPSTGTNAHLYMELLKGLANFDMIHVPYKGGGPAMNDLLGGQVQAILISITLSAPNVRAGKAKAFAVASEKRSPALPQVPTFAEVGVPDFTPNSWAGLFLPAATPQPIVQRIHAEYLRAFQDADVMKRLQELNAEPVMNSPDQFAAYLKTESERLGRLIRARNITAD